ncbi:MAG: polyprenyl synthetase family protein [Phycisphaeraceae bacterium]|nr:polyprenyl synthetase family protein [Phycisphaeraceae bacterium]MCB9848711.1 polyprenyl synthetase family protein [Phycisphaeraceae bacterium]
MTTAPTQFGGPVLALADQRGGLGGVLRDRLASTVVVMERELRTAGGPTLDLVAYVERYRGKMLRPTLVHLAGLACGGLSPEHDIAAAVVETIHLATLVHDDVLDDAEIRRRGQTINALHGNEAAVILGDYLIASAFHLCSSIADQSVALRVGEVTKLLCEGELLQLHHRDDFDLELDEYYRIIDRKTASLIALAAELGARLAGADDETVRALEGFGRWLGIAFQIRDDLLDLVGEQPVVGKDLGKDLDKGKMTLPVIHHLRNADAGQRASTLGLLERLAHGQSRDRDSMRSALEATGSIDAAKEAAREHLDRARKSLRGLSESPARGLLDELAEEALRRDR